MRYAIGIDVGGTKTAYGLFDGEKRLLATGRHRSDGDLAPERFFDGIAEAVRALCREKGVAASDLLGVGIGMPSFVRWEDGHIIKTVNLTNIRDFPAKSYLSERLGVPVALDNDARTAALAEHRQGAGQGFRDMLYCPMSTGISSAIIIGGKLFRGSNGFAGESGHMLVTPGVGIECGCGHRGCYMSYCSGSMIMGHIRHWIAEGQPTVMTELACPEDLTTVHLCEAYHRGDAMAVHAVAQMVSYLSTWLYNLYQVFNIDCFVFGGGLLQMDLPLLQMVRDKFNRYNLDGMPVHFKSAALGEHFGIIGAAELLFLE